jgi:hypothetical protein
LSPQFNSDACLLCKGSLAEACIENAIPNWHFTYTGIPLPESLDCSSGAMVNARVPSDSKLPLAPLLSPVQRFHSNNKEYFSTDSSTAFTTGESLGNLSATLEKLKADLEMQREMMNELKDEQFRNRSNNNHFKSWRRPIPLPGKP